MRTTPRWRGSSTTGSRPTRPCSSTRPCRTSASARATCSPRAEERADPSAYNTYKHTGLPPGPIGSPGEKTIEAALNPAEGDWLYFVAVNLETGETVFSDTKAEHDKAVAQLQEYCRGADDC